MYTDKIAHSAIAAAFCAFFLAGPVCGQSRSASAPDLATAVARLAGENSVTVSVRLSDLGVRRPVVLTGRDARHDLFLPIPAGLPVRGAVIQLRAHYLRGDAEQLSYVAAIDGTPLVASSVKDDQGDILVDLPVTDGIHAGSFLDLNVAWSSVVSRILCGEDPATGWGILELSPDTRLSYSYDQSAVRDIAQAWNALGQSPVLLVAGGTLSQSTYDTAWRLGAVLSNSGKHPKIHALPQVGDEIDTTGLDIPAPLSAIPLFRDLAGGGRHKIASAAQVGLLLLLANHGGLRVDLAVDDPALRAQLDRSMAALQAELANVSPKATAALDGWVSYDAKRRADNLHLIRFGNRAVLAAKPGAPAAVAGALANLWHDALVTRAVGVAVGKAPAPVDRGFVDLDALGAQARSFDVLARGSWTATFDLANPALKGKVPETLRLEVSAAPGASTSSPVASVFLNNYLLGARKLKANGKPERISVAVPDYALAAHNVLSVTFQRQTVHDRCREVPQAFPVAVLPASGMTLGDPPSTVNFVNAMLRLSDAATVFVPQAYLNDAASLSRLASLSAAARVSPEHAVLSVVPGGTAIRPDTPFLAMEVPVGGVTLRAKVEGGRLRVDGANDAAFLDVAGLDRLAVLQVARAHGQLGIVYHVIGNPPPLPETPIVLGRGDVALITARGVVDTVATRGEAPEDGFFSWSNWGTFLMVLGVALFITLLLLAYLVRRRATRKAD